MDLLAGRSRRAPNDDTSAPWRPPLVANALRAIGVLGGQRRTSKWQGAGERLPRIAIVDLVVCLTIPRVTMGWRGGSVTERTLDMRGFADEPAHAGSSSSGVLLIRYDNVLHSSHLGRPPVPATRCSGLIRFPSEHWLLSW